MFIQVQIRPDFSATLWDRTAGTHRDLRAPDAPALMAAVEAELKGHCFGDWSVAHRLYPPLNYEVLP